jgi:hypothetical protein
MEASSPPGVSSSTRNDQERLVPAVLGGAHAVGQMVGDHRSDRAGATCKGRLIQTGLRLVGPILLGLALLSIRGRVKR